MKLSTLNSKMQLLSVSTNAKTIKSDQSDKGVLTAICYLAPSTVSGHDTCPNAGNCKNVCLGWYAGRSRFSNVQQARIRKTKLYFENKPEFLRLLRADLDMFKAYCQQEGKKGFVRINGSSDLKIEDDGFMQDYPDLQFYDYTKREDRAFGNLPSNYHLTYSRDERTKPKDIQKRIKAVNIAVVFDKVPNTYMGIPVIDGDKDDLRPLDKKGVIVGLKAKGSAKKDESGFVVKMEG